MKNIIRFAAIASALTGSVVLGGVPVIAHAQAPQAPPVDNTYNWHDVPVGQQVQITRAVFDQGGYQLYASTGELIVVPFENQNLYVMKFGQTGGSMYFVNDGSTPTLYVPAGGYLENAAVQGAKWYPFPQQYHYTQPEYLGFAPSWSAYTSMGWYPGMVYYGGYGGYHPWHVGLSFSPLPGLLINIGGHPYYGWGGYHDYYYAHPYNRVYVSNFRSYNYHSVPHRPTSFFVANHTRFVNTHTTVYNNRTVIHNNTVVHNNFGSHGGSFGRGTAARPFGGGARPAFGGGNHAGSFGTNHTGGFGGTHASRPFGGGATSGGGSRPFGGGTRSAAPFGGSHAGSFGGGHSSFGGGGGNHGSFGGGGGSHAGSFGGANHGGGGGHDSGHH